MVRFHASTPGGGAHRISDSVPPSAFRGTALYADYYAPVGLDHALALPLHVDARLLATLTPREREVLGWVAAGKTNAQIGPILGATPRTIAKHLERIFEKLGVETRTAAATRVLNHHPG